MNVLDLWQRWRSRVEEKEWKRSCRREKVAKALFPVVPRVGGQDAVWGWVRDRIF
jgi:hypothetical protein